MPDTLGGAEMAQRTCSIDGCEKPHFGRGWCEMHYRRWYEHGDPLINRFPNRGTGRYVNQLGYVALYRPDHPLADADGRVAEHRLVAFDAGLLTDLSLVVHHINGRKTDNRLANLVVKTNEEHSREHALEPDGAGTRNARKTHCPRGHPYDEANTRWYQGKRTCRACARERSRVKRAADH